MKVLGFCCVLSTDGIRVDSRLLFRCLVTISRKKSHDRHLLPVKIAIKAGKKRPWTVGLETINSWSGDVRPWTIGRCEVDTKKLETMDSWFSNASPARPWTV